MRLYVTGATTLVGSNIVKIAQERHNDEVIGAYSGQPPQGKISYALDPLDLKKRSEIRASLRRYRPQVVIHTAGMSDLRQMAAQRASAWAQMVEATRTLAQACREIGARLIFVSTDWVYDGREPGVSENTPPFPINYYGVLKMASERDITAIDGLSYGIGRLAGVYGINYAIPSLTRWSQSIGFDGLPNYVYAQLSRRRVAAIWMGENVNEVAHPTLASDAAEMLLRLARHTTNGVLHCFGSEPIGRVELAHRVAEVFNLDHHLINAVPLDPEVARDHRDIPIPRHLRASTARSSAELGRVAFSVNQGLQMFRRQCEALGAFVPA